MPVYAPADWTALVVIAVALAEAIGIAVFLAALLFGGLAAIRRVWPDEDRDR